MPRFSDAPPDPPARLVWVVGAALLWGSCATPPPADATDPQASKETPPLTATPDKGNGEAGLSYVRLRRLRISKPQNPAARKRARRQFQRLRREIVEGTGDFGEAARALPAAPDGRPRGILEAWRPVGQLAPPLARRVRRLAPSEYATVETDAALWLVRLEQRRRCTGPDPSCRERSVCIHDGKCCRVGGRCRVGTDRGCRQSQVCRHRGACRAGPRGCEVGRDAHCRNSRRCRRDGACFRRGRRCGVELNVDCRRSEACRTRGACVALHGECLRKDVARERCLTLGRGGQLGLASAAGIPADFMTDRLAPIDGACRLPAEFQCAELCKQFGQCKRVVSRHCIPDSDDEQACSPPYAVCRAPDDAACRASRACRRRGMCEAVTTTLTDRHCPMRRNACRPRQRRRHICMADAASCATSRACRERGACGVVVGRSGIRRCAPTQRSHCIDAEICESDGRCRLSGDRCTD